MISECFLANELVSLRPVHEGDLPHFQRWLGDAALRRFLGGVEEQPTIEEEFDWYVRRREDPDSLLWAIEAADGALLGNVELRLNVNNRRAEVGIAIFDREHWGQGLGTAAMRLVLEHAFAELELNRVELTTDHDNPRAIRSYEKCGFVREGALRQRRIIDGEPNDSVLMAILREDWLGAR